MKQIIEQIRIHLEREGIVRYPHEVGGGLPPAFIELPAGCPDPDQVEDAERKDDPDASVSAVVHISSLGADPTTSFNGFMEARQFDIEVRARDSKIGERLCTRIVEALDDRRHWQMGDIIVSSSLCLGSHRRVPWRYTEHGVVFSNIFRIAARRSDLREDGDEEE